MAATAAGDLESYAEQCSTPDPPFLARVMRETQASLSSPQMLSGPVQGRFLEMLVFALQARSVVEVGTYAGYSSLAMAEGMPPGGRIRTLELDPDRAEFARRQIEASPYPDRIEVIVGPALESLQRLDGPFDFAFVDADKQNYVNYYEALLPKLADHGLLAADNTLWGARALDGRAGDSDRAIHAFNEHVRNDPRVRSVILAIRDGITLVRKAR
ncbi:MAG: O-methyltransferase [Gaiellaceae bacterium]